MDWNEAQAKLAAPFPADDVEWRIGRAGEKNGSVWAMCLAYVTNRAIQNRLDAVFGIDGWRNEYAAGPEGGVICGISVWHDERKWITKWDGAPATDIEAVKGGLSDSMKRAAVQWGIGRYLYKLPEGWADCGSERSPAHPNRGSYKDKNKVEHTFWWAEPALPAWALPEGEAPKAASPRPSAPPPAAAPAKPRPAPQQSLPTANHLITVKTVAVKEGEGPKGPWERTTVEATSGDRYSTFDRKLGALCVGLEGKDCYIEFTDDGKYKTLKSIEVA